MPVCSPPDNARFLKRVAELAPRVSETQANLALWNARRSGKLAHLPPSKPYSPPRKLRHYEFAVEWAFRFVIRQLVAAGADPKHTTLERILCVPEWRERLDAEVVTLTAKAEDQFSLLDYRWTAMTVRKRAGESKAAPPTLFTDVVAVAAAPTKLPNAPGVFEIRTAAAEPLYTGWARNLRHQAVFMTQAGDGTLVPDRLLAGGPAKSGAFHVEAGDPADTRLEELWRGNLTQGAPALNILDGVA